MNEEFEKTKEKLRQAIVQKAYVKATDEPIYNPKSGVPLKTGWIFDFRRIFFNGNTLYDIQKLFWYEHKNAYPIQIGGLEAAAIPIISAIHMHAPSEQKEMSSFFIRKSRKKDRLTTMVEGSIVKKRPIVLVDDVLNSGKTFIRQVEVLEELGHKVSEIWVLLRFREESYYSYFHDKNITVRSLFSLNDFTNDLGVSLLDRSKEKPISMPYEVLWKFQSENPNYRYIVPKSDPVIDAQNVYVGSDAGVFWSLRQEDGSVQWKKKVGFHAKGKSIFSSPLVHNGVVYFGAYDGNVYALEATTGKKKWIFFGADWIGSSPALAENLNILFVGLEFGLFKKRGALVALNATTGKKLWQYDMPLYTHATPLYIPGRKQVVIGSNDGAVYLFNARNGRLIWKYQQEDDTPSEEELLRGFSKNEIKESAAYDAKNDRILVANTRGEVLALERKNGKLAWKNDNAQFGFYSTPLVHKNTVLVSSLDKHLYALNVETGEELWRWHAGARIFASPTIIHGNVFVGSNTGRLTELNPETGEERSFITVPERITNKVAYNETTQRYFLPTFANEVYCLERTDEQA